MLNIAEALDYQLRAAGEVRSLVHRAFLGELGYSPDIATFWAKTQGEALEMGETFYWAPNTCALLAHSAPDLPQWTMLPEFLPAESGFCFFSTPLEFAEGSCVRGISWCCVEATDASVAGTAVIVHLADFESPIPATIWEWGKTQVDSFGPHLRRLAGLAPEPKKPDEEWQLRAGNYFGAMCTFLRQKIVVSADVRLDRASRRRLGREHPTMEPSVRVVELRAREYAGSSNEPVDVDWACRWIVRGHWRQQWYPSLGIHQPKWVLPYVKGPEDKPLKPSRGRMFAVVR